MRRSTGLCCDSQILITLVNQCVQSLPRLRCYQLIVVMKPTHFWNGDHLPLVRTMDWARLWTIHRARQMRPPPVIIGQVADKDALKMLLVEDNHMIETLPRTGRGSYGCLRAESVHIWSALVLLLPSDDLSVRSEERRVGKE